MMKKRWLTGILTLALCATALGHDTPSRGHLMLIGGGDKPVEAMAKFVELAGGKDAPIVVIPTASGEADTPSYYLELFRKEHGATDVVVLPIKVKADTDKPEHIAAAKRARGIFFSGGDQSRILDALEGTRVLEAMGEAYRNGAVVGGTSAGTACQSVQMITGEGDFKVIRGGAVELRNGLGFLRGAIVDQHFIARQRENRLITVLLEHPDQLGIGVDEDTAVWVKPDDTFEVIGARSVMVFDASQASVQRGKGEKGKELLGVHGMRMHIVLPGESFDLARRAPRVSPAAEGAAR
jgi:cyanophycinase